MNEKIYLCSLGAQKQEIEKTCFPCGKIIFGMVTFMGGFFSVCKEYKCKHEKIHITFDKGNKINGKEYSVIVRKLKGEK